MPTPNEVNERLATRLMGWVLYIPVATNHRPFWLPAGEDSNSLMDPKRIYDFNPYGDATDLQRCLGELTDEQWEELNRRIWLKKGPDGKQTLLSFHLLLPTETLATILYESLEERHEDK